MLNFAAINRRAKRDAKAEQEPRDWLDLPRAGTEVGHIEFALHGQVVRARLVATGRHCRSYRVMIEDECIGRMGADKAWHAVSPRVYRMMSLRNLE